VACFSPLTAYQAVTGEIFFAARTGMDLRRELSLPCGQCIGCRLERSRQWAIRCMHESQMHENSSFITLTYNDDNCPVSLDYRHFQLFMKRTRKFFSQRLRFFMCGEYGDEFGRPHFHACVFGAFFNDRERYSKLPSGSWLYTSNFLSTLWPYGFSSIGDVTFESAAYVARYVCKKVTGAAAEDHYRVFEYSTGEIFTREPEFAHMSLKPGIGRAWYDKFKSDVYPSDEVVIRGAVMKPPKYYDKLYAADSDSDPDALEFSRYQRAIMFAAENTPERLAAREVCVTARMSQLKRSIK